MRVVPEAEEWKVALDILDAETHNLDLTEAQVFENVLYQVYEFQHAVVSPFRAVADLGSHFFRNPLNPWTYTYTGRSLAAAFDVFEATTRRYGKPLFDLPQTMINGEPVDVTERVVWTAPFADLLHFEKAKGAFERLRPKYPHPKVLIVAPMSGHYATLLRGTVEGMLPEHDVYITDWRDARLVPMEAGGFHLDDYIDYVREMLSFLGPGTHVMAVCQPGPAVLAAAALMAEDKDPAEPASMVIMGSPIDARKSPTVPNKLSEERPLSWFRRNMISAVPFPHSGVGRRVYPGFMQLTSFISMNRDRHVNAHYDYFKNLIKGDGDNTQKHREFYDEYLAVMDITAEFYLETIDRVFQRHLLPKGELRHRGRLVRPGKIRAMALMTVEGEKDDISGIGQTQAAHELCGNIPADRHIDYIQPGVGHYGVFNGKRWRTEIQPRVRDFIRSSMA
ncbi:MAG: polyhydroxyalkanoate depolymerase [Alphaproteobacteria bacterium]|nr:polyhydroxyalkanoate depolymerase [Alphaproteobacteria bacterium]